MQQITTEQLHESLHKYFGFNEFRPNQQGIIEALINRRDVFAVMPTGGGKSLCFQLPACLLPGTCVVISPLISLMKDQVDGAQANGLKAAFLNSSQSTKEISDVFLCLHNNMLDLLYVSPERFAMPEFLEVLKEIPICLFAIDEAHCISEWGHDFRPDYLSLASIKTHFPNVPIAAFTASATPQVQQDIVKKLELHDPNMTVASFDRHNLFYTIEPKTDANQQTLEFIKKHADQPGIVYRTTRNNVEETAQFLSRHNISSLPYHAGLTPETRKKHQDSFNKDEIQVIVATVAFGMGIDKSNVRFIVHADIPKHIEGYYQETGRAGRDGEPAFCMLLFSRGDLAKFHYFIDQIEDEKERLNSLKKLREVAKFASTNTCRRKQLLRYFGETYKESNCKTCDICVSNVEAVDSTVDAQKIMSAIARVNQSFGITHIIDLVWGADTKRIRELRHDQIKTYGVGKDQPKTHWRMIIDELVARDCLVQTSDTYPVLKLTQKGLEILHGRQTFTTYRKIETEAAKHVFDEYEHFNHDLFESLRQLRKSLAQHENIAPFTVFSDRTLHDMCKYFPQGRDEMLMVSGVGEAKFEKYGKDFLHKITQFIDFNPDVYKNEKQQFIKPLRSTRSGKKSRSHNGLSSTILQSYEMLKQGHGYEEVAEMRELTPSTIAGHIEKLLMSGYDLDVDQYVKPEQRIEGERLFAEHGTQAIKPIVDNSNGTISYAEARIIKGFIERENAAS